MHDDGTAQVLRAYEAFNRRDAAGVLACGTDDTVWEEPGDAPYKGVHRGKEEVTRFLHALLEFWAEFHIEVEELHDLGAQVFTVVHQRARVTPTSPEVETRVAHLWTIRDDGIGGIRVFLEVEEGRRAAGLPVG